MKLLVVFVMCFISMGAMAQLDITKRNITVTNKLVVAGNKAQYKTKVARTTGDSLSFTPFWAFDELNQGLDSVVSVQVITSNATPVNVDTIAINVAEIVTIEVIAAAKSGDGNGAYVAKKARSFNRNAAGTLTNGVLYNERSDEYFTGLSTATFSITNAGSDKIVIQWTGEASNIEAIFTYTITRIKIAL